jgi:hypothetical protein
MSNTIFSRKQKVGVGQNSREDWKVSGKVSKYKKKEREKSHLASKLAIRS